MIGIFCISDSKLEGWTFGVDAQELIRKVETLQSTETNPLKRAELEELIDRLSEMESYPTKRTQLTQNYYLVTAQTSLPLKRG